MIVGFNASHTGTPLEFPLWQGLTGIVLRHAGGGWAWGNVVAWLCFASCLWPFFRLARDPLGERAAGWVLLAFVLQPLIVLNAGQAGTDGLSLAASVWFLYFARRLAATGEWKWWSVAAFTGALAATQKVPFFMATGVASAWLLWRDRPANLRPWVQLALVGAFATAVFAFWTLLAERELARAEFPLLDLRISGNPAMHAWYFGNWEFRANPFNWARGAYRVLVGEFGSFPLAIVALAVLAQPAQKLARSWAGGVLVATFVYCHLVLYHWHYYLMLSPAIALLTGDGLARIEQFLRQHTRISGRTAVAGGFAVLLLACVQGSHAGNFFLRDDHVRLMAATIAQRTLPADRLLVANGGWGGDELMIARRQGLSITDTAFLEQPANLARIRALGYTKLVALSQSEKRTAVALLGGSVSGRTVWPSLLTPVTRTWPVVYQNNDLCIFEIPADASRPTL
jgi:hypothetical protein